MRLGSAAGFACAASAAALVGAAALLPWIVGSERLAAAWAIRGFLAMAIPGIIGGAWLAREHGGAGSRFVVAMGAGFAARLGLAALAAMGAAKSGPGAVSGLLPGLAAGFVPVTAFEMLWFARAARVERFTSETRG